MQRFKRRTAGLLVREMDDEILVLDTESDRVHQLNQTAALVWRHLETAREPHSISEVLSQQYTVSMGTALRDVTETLSRLSALNLIIEITEGEQSSEKRDEPGHKAGSLGPVRQIEGAFFDF